MKKYQNFLFESFPFFVINFSIYLNSRVFVMESESKIVMNRNPYKIAKKKIYVKIGQNVYNSSNPAVDFTKN